MSRNAPNLVLYQFAFSHFNEKARWALDWNGLAYEGRNLLPGFHARRARKLSGATQVPILVVDEEPVAGSTQILRRLDALAAAPGLFPADPSLRAEAESWIAWLDEEVGPATRLGLFHELLAEPEYAVQLFLSGQPAWKRGLYARLFPKMIPILRKKMSITEESAAQANEKTAKALDRITSATATTGYLVGDRFSAADLTAAALLFPLSFPPELHFALPDRPSAAASHWKARWAGHPGVAWMEEIFRRHRHRGGND